MTRLRIFSIFMGEKESVSIASSTLLACESGKLDSDAGRRTGRFCAMTITPHLFAAYLKCPTKCWLRSTGVSASGNVYAGLVRDRDEASREKGIKRLIAEAPEGSQSEAAKKCKDRFEKNRGKLFTFPPQRLPDLQIQGCGLPRFPALGREGRSRVCRKVSQAKASAPKHGTCNVPG